MNPMRGLCFALLCLALVGRARADVWISPQTNALGQHWRLGSGTQADPYYGDFDWIVSGLSNTVINLSTGIYFTKGFQWSGNDLRLRKNVQLFGAGTNVTTIRKDVTLRPGDQQNFVLRTFENGVTVSNLTVDCAGQDRDQFKTTGIWLEASGCAVRNVKVVNFAGNFLTKQECAGIAIGYTGTSNNIVADCAVFDAVGTYGDGIAMAGSGLVSNNMVTMPTATTKGLWVNYVVTGTRNGLFCNNTSYGGMDGFWTDTGCETNLTITENAFRHCKLGIYFGKSGASGGYVDGLYISNNVVTLSTTNGSAIGIELAALPPITFHHMYVLSNSFLYDASPAPSGGIGIYITVAAGCDTNVVNLTVVSNLTDHAFSAAAKVAAQGVVFVGNVDSLGIPMTSPLVLPWFCQHPRSQTVYLGQSVTLTGSAVSGAIPVHYQWSFNGAPLSGATTASYIISNVGNANAGSYSVRASNSAGVANSAVGVLTVLKP